MKGLIKVRLKVQPKNLRKAVKEFSWRMYILIPYYPEILKNVGHSILKENILSTKNFLQLLTFTICILYLYSHDRCWKVQLFRHLA